MSYSLLLVLLDVQDNLWLPSQKQDNLMTALCGELHLNKASVIAGLDNHDSYSAKLAELTAQRQLQRAAMGDVVRQSDSAVGM